MLAACMAVACNAAYCARPEPAKGPPPRENGRAREGNAMHYPHRISKVKRARKLGFRSRMRTKTGRKIINNRRRKGQKASSV